MPVLKDYLWLYSEMKYFYKKRPKKPEKVNRKKNGKKTTA